MIPPILLDDYLVSPQRLSAVSRDARLLYLLLGNEVDQFGGFSADPDALAAKLYPNDPDVAAETVARWLRELDEMGFIRPVDGSPASCIVGWLHSRKDELEQHMAGSGRASAS